MAAAFEKFFKTLKFREGDDIEGVGRWAAWQAYQSATKRKMRKGITP